MNTKELIALCTKALESCGEDYTEDGGLEYYYDEELVSKAKIALSEFVEQPCSRCAELEAKIEHYGRSLKACDIHHETSHLALCDRQAEEIARLRSAVERAELRFAYIQENILDNIAIRFALESSDEDFDAYIAEIKEAQS